MAIQNLLPVAVRTGTLVSNPYSVPASAALCRTCSIGRDTHDTASPGHAFVPRTATFSVVMPAPDKDDPSKTGQLGAQKLVGAVWKEQARIRFQGGTFTNPFNPSVPLPPPGFTLQGEEMAGYDIRVGLVLDVSMQIGVQVEFL